MKPEIKSGLEYTLLTLLVAGLCLWQLLSGAQEEDTQVARVVVMGLGLTVALAMHCVFAMQLVRRTGRAFWPWFVAVVLFMPVGTAVLLALLLSEADAPG